MKVLMFTTKYPLFGESEWLTSELANELVKRNISVDVFDVEWAECEVGQVQKVAGLTVHRVKPFEARFFGRFGLIIKWVFSSFQLYPLLLRDFFLGRRYDLFICYSPCTALAGAIPLAKLLSNKSILIYWDFFPIHNQQISGKVPRVILPFLKYLECSLVKSFSRVSCMSPANLKFFNSYFGSAKQKRDIVPIWSSFLGADAVNKKKIRSISPYRDDEILVVFGGQLVSGRGIETLLLAITQARKLNPMIKLLVCGSGHLSGLVSNYCVENLGACDYLGTLSRNEYLKVLSYSDIGVVATVEGVESPTYPSKSLDYMASSLPIVACIERSSDFGEIVEANNIGRSCSAGDVLALSKILVEFSFDPFLRDKLGAAALDFLRLNHSVSKIADKILEG